MQNNYVSVCLLGMRSCNMADISRYSVLNLMRSSTDVIHNLLFVCHYFILWCQVLNICLCPLYPALHMTPVYEEEVHAPIFILAASLSPQRKSGLEYFISKVYGSLEQPCWLSGAEVLILTMVMQCKSCELIEGYMYYREPTSRTRFLISVNWKFLNHSTHKIGGLHWWFNMSSKMTTSWPWKELHDRQRCQTSLTCLLHVQPCIPPCQSWQSRSGLRSAGHSGGGGGGAAWLPAPPGWCQHQSHL